MNQKVHYSLAIHTLCIRNSTQLHFARLHFYEEIYLDNYVMCTQEYLFKENTCNAISVIEEFE